jgi:glutaredoxin
MTIIQPTLGNFTVYTKTGCLYCDKVKDLLIDEMHLPTYVSCDDYIAIDREQFLEDIDMLCGRVYRRFPMVFYDGKFIGGFVETKEFIRCLEPEREPHVLSKGYSC